MVGDVYSSKIQILCLRYDSLTTINGRCYLFERCNNLISLHLKGSNSTTLVTVNTKHYLHYGGSCAHGGYIYRKSQYVQYDWLHWKIIHDAYTTVWIYTDPYHQKDPLVLLLCQALQNKPVKEHTKETILCAVILCRSVLSCFNLWLSYTKYFPSS